MFDNLFQISLKFVPEGLIDSKSALVQVMAWCPTDDNTLTELMFTKMSAAIRPQ